jgi:hypothetical protein
MTIITDKYKTKDYVYDISLDGTFVNALGMNVCSNTDGFNFKLPSEEELETRHYIGKGLNREVEKNKEYTGFKADVAEFNDLYMRGKMGLGIDEVIESSLNYSRKNYSDLLFNEKTGEREKKLVGNTVKSKKMPVYIEKFLDNGIDLLLNQKGQEFIEYYYSYIDKIYNYQIPLRDIASKGKIKKSLDDYKKDCREVTKSGNKKSRQAWYELLLRKKPCPVINIADVIYYINTGKKKSDSDVKRVSLYYQDKDGVKTDITKDLGREFEKYKKKATDIIKNSPSYSAEEIDKYAMMSPSGKLIKRYSKLEKFTQDKEGQFINSHFTNGIFGEENIYSEDKIYLNCELLDNDIIESEDEIMCSDDMEYNCEKYIAMFNKRITPLLVCFKPEIREKILITNPNDKMAFTEQECELDSGHPIRESDQDTYEALMTPSRQEVEYWITINEEPPFIKEMNMDWEGIKKNYYELIEKEKNARFQELNDIYIRTVENLSEDEITALIEESEIPSSLLKYVSLRPEMNDLNLYFNEIPEMSPTRYSYIGDINHDIIERRKSKSFLDFVEQEV